MNLPANTVITLGITPLITNADKVNNHLSFSNFIHYVFEFRVLISDHNSLGKGEHPIDIIYHQLGNVRD